MSRVLWNLQHSGSGRERDKARAYIILYSYYFLLKAVIIVPECATGGPFEDGQLSSLPMIPLLLHVFFCTLL